MLTAAIAVAAFRNWPVRRLIVMSTSTLGLGVAITMIGIEQQQVAALLAGTMIAGAGFGSTFSGTLRALLPTAEPHQRAGLLSAFYLQSYLAFAVPAVVAGLSVPQIGLATTAYIYGALIILLAFISMIASLWADRRRAA
jgi:predicted MFS family arabinose efflux permease